MGGLHSQRQRGLDSQRQSAGGGGGGLDSEQLEIERRGTGQSETQRGGTGQSDRERGKGDWTETRVGVWTKQTRGGGGGGGGWTVTVSAFPFFL